MHELSIAQSLIELVEDELATQDAADLRDGSELTCRQVGRIVVKVGALSGVVPAALAHAFAVAVTQSSFRSATLAIDECPVVVWCENCSLERTLPSPQRMCCPVCGAKTPTVRSGRELELVSIEVSDAATNPAGQDADPQEE